MPALKPYVLMMPSGIPWLGDIPKHWPLVRVKALLAERSEKDHPDRPLLAATQTKGVVRKESYENRTVLALKDLHLLKLVEEGDFVISLRSFQGGIEYARDSGIISPAYTVLYPKDPRHHRFLALVFKSRPFLDALVLSVTGIREGQNIDYGRLARSALPLPPIPEQNSIVRFLDHMDRRIRMYIRAKEKLIELLDEYKRTLIHQAVTGQIDVRTGKPYGEYKESGVGWLGRVPAHWDIRRLRTLAHIKTGDKDTINRRSGGNYPFFVRSQTVEKINSWSFDGEAVLTAGDGVGVGKVFHYINGKFDYHQRVYKFSDFRDVVGKFFFQYFRASLRLEVFQGTAKSTVDSLRLPMLKNFPVVFPDSLEQLQIARYIDRTVNNVDAAVARSRSSVELLREYRTRIIADVVTGKLDVREAAAKLGEFDSSVAEPTES